MVMYLNVSLVLVSDMAVIRTVHLAVSVFSAFGIMFISMMLALLFYTLKNVPNSNSRR